jgi:hypothetical protein
VEHGRENTEGEEVRNSQFSFENEKLAEEGAKGNGSRGLGP